MQSTSQFSAVIQSVRAIAGILAIGLCVCGTSVVSASVSDPAQAARSLAHRLLAQRADQFRFQTIPADHNCDLFEIESRGGKILIRGNNGVAMAMGLNWYLRDYCHCHVSLYGSQLTLPNPLPPVHPKFTRTAWAKYRYFLNYCCFGYSLPWWDWAQWEKLIDWMALNGVNLPLSVTGQEAVWQAVCRREGMSEDQIFQFLAGPPYLPFQWMGCLDNWGAPLTQNWINRHEELQKQILARERELGMTPVLQGFTGHLPAVLLAQHPEAKSHRIKWIEWETALLDPLDPLFPKLARIYLEEQHKRFGTDHVYAADTFIEMTPPSGDVKYLANLSRAIYDGMATSDPQALWVLQGWAFMNQAQFWTQPRIRAFLDAVPNERMAILDLFCESTPMWNRTEAFCGKPWLWCNVQNFGRTVALGGALPKINADPCAIRHNPAGGKLAGLGFVNEGLDYNPVVWDLMFEMAWREEPVDLDSWIRHYSRHRYGRPNPDAEAAWALLRQSVYEARFDDNSIIAQVPSLKPANGTPYDDDSLSLAWKQLLDAAPYFSNTSTYRFDLVNIARQALANHASNLQHEAVKAQQAGDATAFRATADRFLHLIRDLDTLLGSREEFLLGSWLADARRWGTTDAEQARFEWNARRVLTLWGTRAPRDYARKQWSGLLTGFYLKRWDWFFRDLEIALKNKQPFDDRKFQEALEKWETDWSDARDIYPSQPQGDSVAIARQLWAQYGPVILNGGERELESLTTGKPVQCSHTLPGHPAHLANNGRSSNTDQFWATDVTIDPAAWWQVDLEKPTTVGRVVVIGYYGDARHYGFTVATSLDAQSWELAADWRDNSAPSTAEGYNCEFVPRSVRYIRITMSRNSANTGRHLVEVMAYDK